MKTAGVELSRQLQEHFFEIKLWNLFFKSSHFHHSHLRRVFQLFLQFSRDILSLFDIFPRDADREVASQDSRQITQCQEEAKGVFTCFA